MDRLIRARWSSESGLCEGEEGARVSFILAGEFEHKPMEEGSGRRHKYGNRGRV